VKGTVKTSHLESGREKRPRDSTSQARARLTAYALRERLAYSRDEEVVVDAFLDADGHLTLEELTAIVRRRAPAIGQSTVYRALKLLEDCGLATVREFTDGPSPYELVPEGIRCHQLVCTGCGAVVDFEEDALADERDLALRHGFEVHDHRVMLYGRCASCQSRSELERAGSGEEPMALGPGGLEGV
jgi:Fur family transcriptional regulator, ferric uptake regulator